MGAVKALLTTGVVYLRSLAAGGGSGSYTPGGLLTSNTTTYTALGNTNEQDMWTYSLPAATMNTDGRGIRITAWGTKAANGNNVTIKVYFGATAVAALSFTTSGAHWRSESIVLRTGAATQLASGDVEVALGNQQNAVTTPGETLANAITLKVTGQSATGTAADYVFRGVTVELLP